MIYFIPAWYSNNVWKENEQKWYRRRMKSEMDDTVKQVQLFQRNDIMNYKVMLFSYAPNFRHFLHRQGVFRAPYWSCFDAIQCIRRTKMSLLSFYNLKWPENIEFVYSQFVVLAKLNGEKYAQIEFGESGNPIQVDLYKAGKIDRRNVYDDRGLLSCTSVFEDGKLKYDQYLAENGVWKICQFSDGSVLINPESNYYLIKYGQNEREVLFKKDNYNSMEEVIEEVAREYISETSIFDLFCVALHPLHMNLVNKLFKDKKTIYSTFEDRMIIDEDNHLADILNESSYLIADTTKNKALLSAVTGRNKNIENIPIYDTRVDFGISQQLYVQNILLPIDEMPEDVFEETILALAKYLVTNKYARIHIFTRDAGFDVEDKLLDKVSNLLGKHGWPSDWSRKELFYKSEFDLVDDFHQPVLFYVDQCIDEISVTKCVREQRVLLDIRDKTDIFLQISCVSMGVPQILRMENMYMIDSQNGRLNVGKDSISEDLEYYLDDLTNWNNAKMASYELGKKYSTVNIIDKWKEVIDVVKNS